MFRSVQSGRTSATTKGCAKTQAIKLVQLNEGSIYDYHTVTNTYDFKAIPFSKVKAL